MELILMKKPLSEDFQALDHLCVLLGGYQTSQFPVRCEPGLIKFKYLDLITPIPSYNFRSEWSMAVSCNVFPPEIFETMISRIEPAMTRYL